jgi:hypothetical protein
MNKDGTVYRLRGPNPLMKDQVRWDINKIVFHNFSWKDIVIPDPKNQVAPLPSPPEPTPAPKVVVEQPMVISEPKSVLPLPEPVLVPENPPEPTPAPVPATKRMARIHCLPGTIKVYRDELYDEEHRTISYGNKIEFDANIVDRTDLVLALWTTNKKITPGSIIYPQTGHARWWRVDATETSGIGLKVLCIPSNEQPSF